jgi:hypothetical protein
MAKAQPAGCGGRGARERIPIAATTLFHREFDPVQRVGAANRMRPRVETEVSPALFHLE